ncbi:MAG TPA: SDR family NAD(P)-dependent oxidoreductase, partial [Gammaproteobacteria bacterium]|nr:SDR family NAD(P)-dependent oxidoreductase [Gammaproteobacteria bacterium]
MKAPALFDLSGTVAAVTGGNGGIGRGIALGLAEAGASVAILGRNEAKNERVLEELKLVGSPALALRLDVTERDQLVPAMDTIETELGNIGVLVNNAGVVTLSGGVLEESAEDWDVTIETHLT